MKEFKVAVRKGKERGWRFRVMDMTSAMLLRPGQMGILVDNRYGHWPEERKMSPTLYNDCVHWCLPEPIDTWNDFLLEMLKNEGIRAKEEQLMSDADVHTSEENDNRIRA
ncbi:hypothetical protein Dimus_033939 [Dionaea muscipula]